MFGRSGSRSVDAVAQAPSGPPRSRIAAAPSLRSAWPAPTTAISGPTPRLDPNAAPGPNGAASTDWRWSSEAPSKTYVAPVPPAVAGAPTQSTPPPPASEVPKPAAPDSSGGLTSRGAPAGSPTSNAATTPPPAWPGAPANSVLPARASDAPKRAPAARPSSTNVPAGRQASPSRSKRYTAPRPPSLPGAPTTSRSPRATKAAPKRSDPSGDGLVRRPAGVASPSGPTA